MEKIKNFINKFTQKEKRNFLILGGIILLILIGLVAIRQRQLIKKKAAGTGQVNLRFDLVPSSNPVVNQPFTARIMLESPAANVSVSGGQATFTVSNNISINSVSIHCLDPFRGIGYKNVIGQSITVMCAVPPDITQQPLPILSPGISIGLAEVELTPISTGIGSTSLTFTSTRVTQSGPQGSNIAPDVGTGGTTADFFVEPAATGTPIPGATNTPVPTPIGQPPQCVGGIAIENIVFDGTKFQIMSGTTVKLMAYGISDTDGTVSNVNFRFKPKSAPACPSAGDGSLIGSGIHTADINGTDVWTIMWDTTTVPPGVDYDVWASPVDNNGNSCSGNPAANAGNNYCATATSCQNCKTVANVSVWVSLTPVPATGTPVPTGTSPQPTPTLSPTCNLKNQGDANCDGLFNGIDYSILINTQCAKTSPLQQCADLRADFDRDTDVDQVDKDTIIRALTQ